MSLQITQLELFNFRNYQHFTCDSLSKLNIFIGPNAVGKTNLIEGIDLLTSISSFRNARITELLGEYGPLAHICTHVEDSYRSLLLELRIQEGKKRYFLNKKEKPANQLRGIIPSVTFIPDDLSLIKKSHSYRRRALDALGSQLTANYPVIKKDFEQILSQKNTYLKENPSTSFLESINEIFVLHATQLYCYRVSLFEKLLPYISEYYCNISHREEEITAQYIPSWIQENISCETIVENIPNSHDKEQVKTIFYNEINAIKQKEIASRISLIGPHKDSIYFYINGRDMSIYGSQGQQRSLVLAWKLAEVRLIEEMIKVKPILLLDDVMSELDEVRREELMKYILASTQTFITTTNLNYFTQEIFDIAHVVNLQH